MSVGWKVIGIDPGSTGALAYIGNDEVTVDDLPTTTLGSTTIVSAQRLRQMLADIGPVDCVFVENVHANAMSYKGNFTLGVALGTILGVCAALDRPMRRIQPKDWQKEVGAYAIAKSERKNAHRQLAIEMWPQLEGRLRLVKHHNRADALLIAEAGRRTL